MEFSQTPEGKTAPSNDIAAGGSQPNLPMPPHTVFVGRADVLADITHHLVEGRNVCLYGERGIGKTAIIEESVRWLREEKPEVRFLHVVYQAPFSEVLLALVRQLHHMGLFQSSLVTSDSPLAEDLDSIFDQNAVSRHVQTWSPDQLHASVVYSLKRERLLLVLDNVNSVSASDCLWLYEIITATTCLLATRDPEAANVKPLLPSFTLVAVPPLSRHESYTLIDALTVDQPVPGGNRERYQEQVYEISQGHPGAIRDVVWDDAQMLRETGEVEQPAATPSRLKIGVPSISPAVVVAAVLFFAIGFIASVLSHRDPPTVTRVSDEREVQDVRAQLQNLQTEHKRLHTAHAQLQQQLTGELAALGKKVEQLRFAFGRYTRGAQGEAVERIQHRLKELGYYAGEITGHYDQTTMKAVRRFQDVEGLPINGVVNTETWDYLFPEKVTAREAVASTQ